MTNEEIVSLIQSGIRPGDNMELLYQKNDRYIRKIARHYSFNENMDDLMQEAYFGLYEAVKRYEDTAGVLFITYASFWIKQSITSYIENTSQLVKIPVGIRTKTRHFKKSMTAYQAQLGRKPTNNEMCEYLKISRSEFKEFQNIGYQFDNIQSLDDVSPGSEGDLPISDSIPDQSVDIENQVIDNVMENRVNKELWVIVNDNVTQEENAVIIERYKNNMSLAAAGQNIGKSKEKVRTLEASALKKLRMSRVRKLLEEKFEVNYSKAYYGGFGRFANTGYSIVEDIAIKNYQSMN